MNKAVVVCLCLAMNCMALLAVPTINNVKVTPIEPLGLAIDFDLDGTATNRKLSVAMSLNGTNYLARTLIGSTNCVKGANRIYWDMVVDGFDLESVKASVTVSYHPLYCVIDLSEGSKAASYPVSYLDSPPDGGFNEDAYKTTKLVLRRVDAGTFIMGSDQSDESHRVTLTQPFYMGLYEVTQKQWELVMGTNVCSSTMHGKGDAYPVHYLSYGMIRGLVKGNDWPNTNAVDGEMDGDLNDSFLGRLRKRTKLMFDLPTEAQWEYTCRAGTSTIYSYGDSVDDAYMWYIGNSSRMAHEVGKTKPNNWGFFDMHGNVEEYCRDRWGDLLYGTDPKGAASGAIIERGGTWHDNADDCSSTSRICGGSEFRSYNGGCRLSIDLL